MQDAVLIKRILRNDASAFELLIVKYQKLVYCTCFKLLRNQMDSEDISQEVFMEVHRSVEHLRNKDDISAWIYRVTYSKCISHLRKKNPARADNTLESESLGAKMNVDSAQKSLTPLQELENKESAVILFEKIDLLPENQKKAFIMHKLEGYSHKEICEKLNLSQASVESLIYRARTTLRKSLLKYFEKK